MKSINFSGVSFSVSEFDPKNWDQLFLDQFSKLLEESKDGFIVYPELFPLSKFQSIDLKVIADWFWNSLLPKVLEKTKGRPNLLVALGSCPRSCLTGNGESLKHFYNSTPFIRDGQLVCTQDKIYLTPWERQLTSGDSLNVFEHLGAKVVGLTCFDLEQPDLSAQLKQSGGVDVVLGPSATSDKLGSERVLRCASARSVELGAIVFVVPLVGKCANEWVDENEGRQAIFLPSQQSTDHFATREIYSQYSQDKSISFHRNVEIDFFKSIKSQDSSETRPFAVLPRKIRLQKL